MEKHWYVRIVSILSVVKRLVYLIVIESLTKKYKNFFLSLLKIDEATLYQNKLYKEKCEFNRIKVR